MQFWPLAIVPLDVSPQIKNLPFRCRRPSTNDPGQRCFVCCMRSLEVLAACAPTPSLVEPLHHYEGYCSHRMQVYRVAVRVSDCNVLHLFAAAVSVQKNLFIFVSNARWLLKKLHFGNEACGCSSSPVCILWEAHRDMACDLTPPIAGQR